MQLVGMKPLRRMSSVEYRANCVFCPHRSATLRFPEKEFTAAQSLQYLGCYVDDLGFYSCRNNRLSIYQRFQTDPRSPLSSG
jgi:hypothetical protein